MNIQLNDYDEVLKTCVRSFGLTWDRTGLVVSHYGTHKIPNGVL
jgi:hypothetical protein